MLKDLVKIANKLDSLGLSKEADELDNLIIRLAEESSWEMNLFNSAREVSSEEADDWQNRVESAWTSKEDWRWQENEFGYEKLELERDGEIWMIYYSLENEDDIIKVKDISGLSITSHNKRLERLTKDYNDLVALLKDNVPRLADNFGIKFILNNKVYELTTAIGMSADRGEIELEISGKKVGGVPTWPENISEVMEFGNYKLQEYAGLEWLVSAFDFED